MDAEAAVLCWGETEMTTYKELADRLEALQYRACDEAAAILRRLDAAQASVGVVMALTDEYGTHCMHSGLAAAVFREEAALDAEAKAGDKFSEIRAAVEALALQSTPAPKEPT